MRHSFVTRFNELGVAPHIVEAPVIQVSGGRAGVAGIYNHAAYSVPKREAVQSWEGSFASQFPVGLSRTFQDA